MKSARALTIGMFGPAIVASGLLWDLLDRLALQEEGLQGLFSAPAHLLIMAGVFVALIGVPLAIHLAATVGDEARIHARLVAIRQELRGAR
jgi:hypothetical protein